MVELMAIEAENAEHWNATAELWTRACGKGFMLSPRALAYNLGVPMGAEQAGRFAVVDGERVGFVLASLLAGELNGHAAVAPRDLGWLDAIVVVQEFQRRGIGSALLEWAHEWLRGQGRTVSRLCGGLRPFAPGTALEWNADFFYAHGYAPRGENPIVQDFGHDLRDYVSPAFLRAADVECRPAAESDIDALREFYGREFPGRWEYEFEQHLRDGARVADYMVLYSERALDACCVMTFEDSLRPVERFYPAPLPRPWGQVGTVGVSADRRNAGYGSRLLDASLTHLRGRGVRGCIVDWTHHVGYYERFGFRTVRVYEVMEREIGDL